MVISPTTSPKILRPPFPWLAGEHMAIVGDTGTGKTYLASLLLEQRKFVVSFKSKADKTRLPGKIVRTNEYMEDLKTDKLVLYPRWSQQMDEFIRGLERVWRHGAWTVYLDELFFLISTYGKPMENRINRLLTQGRSKDISVVCGMQRPVGISRFALSQATHLIVFRQEGRDIKTIQEATSPLFAQTLEQLDKYQFSWYHRPSRQIYIGRAEDLIV